MQQIADWLEKLGLSEYAQRFAENDIDFTILGDLTDQDLEKIGIASLGHRRKLLRSARMDPEDLREVISAYQKCVAETVRRFDGFVAKYIRDGVLVYFGYPRAHEDDAERAVRAGLELIAAVAGLKTHASLKTRADGQISRSRGGRP